MNSAHRLALVLVTLVACTGDPPEAQAPDATEAEEAELLGAPVDPKSRGFAVGVCQGSVNTNPAAGPVGTCRRGTAKCSGTLVAPNLVLTARHCIHQSDAGPAIATDPCDFTFNDRPNAAGGLRITTDASVMIGAPKWYDAEQIFVPPTNRGCSDDVALLLLASRVRETFPVSPDFSDTGSRPPREVAILGRGALDMTYELDANGDWTGGLVSIDQGNLLRRVAEHLPVTCATNGATPCSVASHEVPTTHVFPLRRELFVIGGTPTTAGDSGAGVFDQRMWNPADGRFSRLVGVATWGFIGRDGKPSNGGVQRIDHLARWMKDVAWTAARRGGYLLPNWAEDDVTGGR